MTTQEFYVEHLHAEYAPVQARFRDDARILKYLRLFTKDENMASLSEALSAQDWTTAFRAAHTLKGLGLNLGFSKFAQLASELTEQLRPCDQAPDEGAFSALKQEYQHILDGLALVE